MFDVPTSLYQAVLRIGLKERNLLEDTAWIAFPDTPRPHDRLLWDIRSPIANSISSKTPAEATRHNSWSEICATQLGNARAFSQVGDRLRSRLSTLLPDPSAFRKRFTLEWFRGVAPEGPIPKILMRACDKPMDYVHLIWTTTTWRLISTQAARSAAFVVAREKKKGKVNLGFPGDRKLLISAAPQHFESPDLRHHRDDTLREIYRKRGVVGTVEYSEEKIAHTGISGQEEDDGTARSFDRLYLPDRTGQTRGFLRCAYITFALCRKTSFPNPEVTSYRFVLDPVTGVPHSYVHVRQTFEGFCTQVPGMIRAIGSLLTGFAI